MSNWSTPIFTPNPTNPGVGIVETTWTDPVTGAVYVYKETIEVNNTSIAAFGADALAGQAKFQANEPVTLTPAQVIAAITPLLTT